VVRYLVGEKYFSFQKSVQTDSRAHPLSYSANNGGSYSGRFRGRGVKLTTHIHLVPKLRMSTAIRLLSHTSSFVYRDFNFMICIKNNEKHQNTP